MLLVQIEVRCHPWVLLYTGRLFGLSPPVYTPYGYLAVPDQQSAQQLPVSPGALQLFFNEALHRTVLKA